LTSSASPPKSKALNASQPPKKSAPPQQAKAEPKPAPVAPAAPVAKVSSPPVEVKQTKSSTPKQSVLAAKALKIISEQTGVSEAELKDDTVLADIGVDSLLSLTIAGAFTEELDVETDPSFFNENPTIGEIKVFFRAQDTEMAPEPPSEVRQPYLLPPLPEPAPQITQQATSVSIVSANAAEAPAVAAAQKPVSVSGNSSLAAKLLEIIAEETGASVSDLTDDTALADAGVDSLLSLVLGGRIREEFDLDIEPETLLSACQTVGDLKTEVLGSAVNDSPTIVVSEDHTPYSPQMPALPTPMMTETKQLEPITRVDSRLDVVMQANEALQAKTTEPPKCPQPADESKIKDAIRIISEETEVPVSDITDDTVLGDIGVDSLLNLVIGGRMRDELELDMDMEMLLTNVQTIRDLKEALQPADTQTSSTSSSSASSSFEMSRSSSAFSAFGSPIMTPRSEMDLSMAMPTQSGKAVPAPTSVVLQGSTKTATQTLFFFPDGSGSATSYAYLPNISKDLLVIGLNSPYLKKAEEMSTITFDDLVFSYVQEVQRRQAHGPYNFAGWSAGGILAFRAAQMLIAAGETVHHLFLMDSPPPEKLDPLPQHFYDYCDTVGIFKTTGEGGKAPKWLVPHFKAMNRILSTYTAVPLSSSSSSSSPHSLQGGVHIFWAEKSVLNSLGSHVPKLEVKSSDPPDMKFLTENRTDFSAGKWGPLFPPGCPVRCFRLEGANHFDMMVSYTISDLR
jgi:acyl carrier protein